MNPSLVMRKRDYDSSFTSCIPSEGCYQRELIKLEREMDSKISEIANRVHNTTDLTISCVEDSLVAISEIRELLELSRAEFVERSRLREESCWLQHHISQYTAQSNLQVSKQMKALNHELLAYTRFPTPLIHLEWTSGNTCHVRTTYNPYTFRSRPIWANSSQGRRSHQLLKPHSIAIDSSSGHIYVADTETDRIQVYNSECVYLKSFTNESLDHPAYLLLQGAHLYIRCYQKLLKLDKNTGYEVSSRELVDRLKGLSIDTEGQIYSCDSASNIVYRFSSSLHHQDAIQFKPYTHTFQQSRSVVVGGSRKPRDLKFVNDSIYILFGDSPYPIQSFTKEGRFLRCVVSREQMEAAYHFLSVDRFGNILVTSPYVQKIKVFSSEGDLLCFIGTPGRSQPGELLTPRGIAVDPRGLVVICDEKLTYCLQAF